VPIAVSRGRLYQEEFPHPNAEHQTSHLSLARTTGDAKIRYFLLVIASAWIFDFYAHASDKWDVSDNRGPCKSHRSS